MTIKESDFISELQFCISENDLIKAKALLQFFSEISPKGQIRSLFEISKVQDKVALYLLAFVNEQPISDENIQAKLYELLIDKACNAHDTIIELIQIQQLKKRNILIRISGELQIKKALPILIDLLLKETDVEVLKEIIKALSSYGASSGIRAIADFIYYGNEELKQEAIFALAEIGGPAAIHQLAEAIRGDSPTDKLIIEALAEIQDKLAISKLCSLMSSHFTSIRNWAIDHLVDIGAKAVPEVIESLNINDEDTVIHTLHVLGSIGDKSAIPAVVKLLATRPENANIRFTAYEALEKMPSTKSAISLAVGLEDTEEHVRLAAARAINKNMSPVLAAGLKNMISPSNPLAETIAATLLDAEADNIFDSIIEHEYFSKFAVNYVTQKTHPEAKKKYAEKFKAKGLDSFANMIEQTISEVQAEGAIKVYAVDDSKMMLRLYMKKIHKLGYEVKIFEFPADAIKEIKKSKPDLVITDLNMPGINGLEMTRIIREKYTKDQLPVLMITTQSDFVGTKSSRNDAKVDNETIMQTGVNMIMHKPFDDDQFDTNVKKLIKQ
ncbi:HEAT repeat domain-containing protein [Desulforegula conservatrix]|uniref:HEAT repeat domain-containing protein n=1 Tax=Desulforegula conservatrix TaxID=153026 RepID=UPI0003FF0474|nr:HEAT repeat domain-containing protein [Desulforegula conservatrix]